MATKNEEIVEAAEAKVEEVVEQVKETVKKAAPKAKAAAEKVEAAVEETAEKVEKAAKKAAAKTAEAVEQAAEKVEKAAKPVAGKAAAKVEKAAKTVEKAAGKAKEKAKKGAAHEAKAFSGVPRLKTKYNEEVVPALKAKYNYKNAMEIPKLEKIIINMGLGSEKENPKGIEAAAKELSTIAGQKAVITKAKKSVANFKVREGMSIGAKVTLRADRMYYFADKFMNIVLPRVRDFRGVSDKSFDGRGNYALGVKEQLIFPEINYDDVDKVRGMNIVFVTSAKTDEEAKTLLAELGMPFATQG